jgi:CysZ protein
MYEFPWVTALPNPWDLQEQGARTTYAAMLNAAFRAIGDLLSPEFRSVLLKAVGLTIALFAAIFLGVELLLQYLSHIPWPWVETLAAVFAGATLLVAFFFLMSPVTAIFAGFFLDGIAEKVEAKHYPQDERGKPLGTSTAVITSLQFALIVLVVNLAVLPLVFTGIGIFALVIANAYLLSREYFEMVAMRHMPVYEARALRKENTPRIFVAGFLPAVLALIPIANLLVPLFSTSYFTHIFKRVQAS